MNTDKHSSYGNDIARPKREGRLRQDVEHRQVKYLNTGIESDHAPIKKLIEATVGFKVRKQAWSAIQGFDGIQMLKKGQFDFWLRRDEQKLRM
ncbi:hypothetical protein VoSk93_10360 [Vibrio owensii]